MQIGYVWRADRPQKGRFRQFMQCDIDILGDNTNLAETELILATSSLLVSLGFKDFTVRINDRKVLKETAINSGIAEDKIDDAFIILDKMDKIGAEGVYNELIKCGFSDEVAKTYTKNVSASVANDNINEIINNVTVAGANGFSVKYDPTLVRGMGYYTGTIFEITMDELGLSVAGGGRYDEMIGKFGGTPTPACGFSIGFERILTILQDRGFEPPQNKGVCYLVDKKASSESIAETFKKANEERKNGKTVMVTKKNKNVKFQKDKLIELGYEEFYEIY